MFKNQEQKDTPTVKREEELIVNSPTQMQKTIHYTQEKVLILPGNHTRKLRQGNAFVYAIGLGVCREHFKKLSRKYYNLEDEVVSYHYILLYIFVS